jgi:gas vesicle protein
LFIKRRYIMAAEDSYGEEGYTVAGKDRYIARKLGRRFFFPLAFIMGGALGAAAAMFLAPYAGPRTREKIRDMSQEMTEKAEACFAGAKEAMSAAADLGKELVQESKPLFRRALDAGKEAYDRERQKSKE